MAPRHAELRGRIADSTGVLSSSARLDESWGRRHLAGEGTHGEHGDTVQLGRLAPAPRLTSFAMRGSLGPRGSCLLRAEISLLQRSVVYWKPAVLRLSVKVLVGWNRYKGMLVEARGVRPSTSERREEELRMEEVESNNGDGVLSAAEREQARLERRVQRRLRKSMEWQQAACDSRRHRIAPAGGPPPRRSPDIGPTRSTHAGYSQLQRDMKEYRMQLPPVTPGAAATQQLLETPPVFWDQGVGGTEKGVSGGWGGEREDWVVTMKPLPSDAGSILASRPNTTAASQASRSRKQGRRSRLRTSQELSDLEATSATAQDSSLSEKAPGADVQIVRRWKYGQPQSVLLDPDAERQMTPAGQACEDCGKTPVMFGLTFDRVIRWCVTCSHHHDGATNLESGAAMIKENRRRMASMRKEKEALARAEVEAWKKKQQKIFDANSAKWESRLAEMLDPSQDSDSLPGSATLTKAGVRCAEKHGHCTPIVAVILEKFVVNPGNTCTWQARTDRSSGTTCRGTSTVTGGWPIRFCWERCPKQFFRSLQARVEAAPRRGHRF